MTLSVTWCAGQLAFCAALIMFLYLMIAGKTVRKLSNCDFSLFLFTLTFSISFRCAEQSAAAGFKYFGILNYAQCWVSKHPPNFHIETAPKDKCYGPYPDSRYACDKKSLGPCVGIPDFQYIYGTEKGLFFLVEVK
jgi:hypothetical protein